MMPCTCMSLYRHMTVPKRRTGPTRWQYTSIAKSETTETLTMGFFYGIALGIPQRNYWPLQSVNIHSTHP